MLDSVGLAYYSNGARLDAASAQVLLAALDEENQLERVADLCASWRRVPAARRCPLTVAVGALVRPEHRRRTRPQCPVGLNGRRPNSNHVLGFDVSYRVLDGHLAATHLSR
jgi:hypothetical protein